MHWTRMAFSVLGAMFESHFLELNILNVSSKSHANKIFIPHIDLIQTLLHIHIHTKLLKLWVLTRKMQWSQPWPVSQTCGTLECSTSWLIPEVFFSLSRRELLPSQSTSRVVSTRSMSPWLSSWTTRRWDSIVFCYAVRYAFLISILRAADITVLAVVFICHCG